MLTGCPHCGNNISSNAKFCPSCKKDPKKIEEKPQKAVCRACSGKIDSSYRSVHYSTTEKKEKSINLQNLGYNNFTGSIDERTVISFDREVHFKSCPHCGEPEPIKFFADTGIATLIRYGFIKFPSYILLIGSILCSFFMFKWPEAIVFILFFIFCTGSSLFFEDKWTRSGKQIYLLFAILILIPLEVITYHYFQDDIDYITRSLFGVTIYQILVNIGYYSGYYWIIDSIDDFF